MILSSEQAKLLQEKLAEEKNPEKAAKIAKEYGIDLSTENMEQLLEEISGGVQELSDDMLEKISGGEEVDIPQIETIREYYRQKGPNLAFILCIYYIPSPICYEIIQVIEKEEGDAPSNILGLAPNGYQ